MPSRKINDTKVHLLFGFGVVACLLAYHNRDRLKNAWRNRHNNEPIRVPAREGGPPKGPWYAYTDGSDEYDSEDSLSSTLPSVSIPTRNSTIPKGCAERRTVGGLQNQYDSASSTSSSSPSRRKSLNLLSFDGGGVRGLSSLLILRDVMRRVAYEESQGNVNNYDLPLPCRYFDVIGGTSAGGLIAIMLGRLGMQVQDCIDVYETLAWEIFDRSTLKQVVGGVELSARLSAPKLVTAIKRTIASNELMLDPNRSCCKTFVVAQDKKSAGGDPKRFRTYGPGADEVKIWEACRATTAAPTYFEPIHINGTDYIDGGVQYNNPAILVELEKGLWPETVEINCLLSIGTGLRGKIEIPTHVMRNPIDGLKAMGKLVTHTEAPHRELRQRYRGKNCYSRLNVDDGKVGEVDLAAFQMMPFIEKQTKKYLRRKDVRWEIERVAKRLAGTSGCSPDHDPDHDAESIKNISAETAKRGFKLKSKSERDDIKLAIYILGVCAEIGLKESGSDVSESDSRASGSKTFAPGLSTQRRNTRSGMSGSEFTDDSAYSDD